MRVRWKVLVLTTILLLTACGGKDTGESIASESEADQQVNRSKFDWRISEWKSDLTDGSAHPIYLNEYKQNLVADELGDRSTVYRVWGNNLYGLDCFSQDSGDDGIQRLYYLDCYDGRAGEVWRHPVSLHELLPCRRMVST